jgi:DHA2 family multidrug resistance protein-like MFS transporter
MTSEAQAQPRWTFSLFMIVLATSIPFVVTGIDPGLLSLNLPAITQDLNIPSDLVGFIGSVATPYLVQQTVEVARGLLYRGDTGVMITMLIITIVPLVVAALAYFLIPRRPQQIPQAAPAGGQETGQPDPTP